MSEATQWLRRYERFWFGSLDRLALRPIDDGAELIFTHARLSSEQTRNEHETGWRGALDKLESYFLSLKDTRHA